jgi:uncharacterized protein (TIGR02246 family)
MKRNLPIIVLAIIVISLALSFTVGESALAQGSHKDEEAIRKVILDGIEAFNRHDAKAGTVFFTEDADFVTVYGRWSKGAAEIERSRKERFETALKEAKIKLLDLRVRFIKPDVAIAHETHELSGMLSPKGEGMPTLRELSIRVLVKKRDKWLITAFHNTVVRAAESAHQE